MEHATLGTRLRVTPQEEPHLARVAGDDYGITITVYIPATSLRNARACWVRTLWQRLLAHAPGLTTGQFSKTIGVGETTLRCALGQRNSVKAPLNCALIDRVGRGILEHLSGDGSEIAAAIATHKTALAAMPSRKRARASRFSDEAKALLLTRAVDWKGASSDRRLAIEREVLEEAQSSFSEAAGWTIEIVHNGLKNRAVDRQPRR